MFIMLSYTTSFIRFHTCKPSYTGNNFDRLNRKKKGHLVSRQKMILFEDHFEYIELDELKNSIHKFIKHTSKKLNRFDFDLEIQLP